MQAVLRFNGSEEIVISNQVGGVMLEVYEGFDGAGLHSNGNDLHNTSNCDMGRCGQERTVGREQKFLKCFSKSQARSIASAIMGAAAEL